jgi:hypothetical protein
MPHLFADNVSHLFADTMPRFFADAVLRFVADAVLRFFAVCPRDYGPRAQVPVVGRNFTDWVCRHTSFQRF